MISLFEKGGIIMWPLLLTSIISLGVVLERILFIIRERKSRDSEVIENIFLFTEQGNIPTAIQVGQGTQDFVARTLVYGLQHRNRSVANALLCSANKELKRFSQGLSTLDTIITLAPLLGLLGTVTGMIHSFGLLGDTELSGASSAMTGGIAEALIATAFGLVIAIVSLIPYNYLNSRLEDARHEIEDACTRLEMILIKPEKVEKDYEDLLARR